MEKKILFVDLDGTLLDDNKDITPGNLEAIQKAADQGHAVVITTGRPLYSTIFQLEKLHMDKPGCYAITSNGALIYDAYTRETIFQTGVDRSCIREAFDEAYKFGLHPQTYSDHGVLCEREDPEIQYYAKSTLVTYEVLEDVTKANHLGSHQAAVHRPARPGETGEIPRTHGSLEQSPPHRYVLLLRPVSGVSSGGHQ